MADSGAYAFRAVMAEDLPLLTDWLRTPEVVRWWGDPEAQAALIEGLERAPDGDADRLAGRRALRLYSGL